MDYVILVKTQAKTGGGNAINTWNLFETEEAYNTHVEDRGPYEYILDIIRIQKKDASAIIALLKPIAEGG